MLPDQLRQLIAEGKTEQALEQLLKAQPPLPAGLRQDATLLSGRFSTLALEKQQDTISFEERNRAQNKINIALLALIDQLPKLPEALKAFSLTACTDPRPEDWARHRNRGTYVLDDQGQLVGLNLCDCGVQDASFLQAPDFQHLQALSLSENPLRTLRLPAQMKALQHLSLGDCTKLRTLAFDGPLPALQTLVADECALSALELPAGMAALRTLDLRKNKLARLTFAGDCPALSFLDASQNALKELRLPNGFGALQYVYLNDNPALATLTFETPAAALEILHLRGCALQKLPSNLLNFKNLQTLYLHGNPLPEIPRGIVPEG
jgi:Leucine-rich repeat (LRR) protein